MDFFLTPKDQKKKKKLELTLQLSKKKTKPQFYLLCPQPYIYTPNKTKSHISR